jgi:tetratricopeptide (TPR) repeat protein
MALIATPLIFGHIYMAVINPASKAGLSGMFSGYVDKHWARHHYTKWYVKLFEKEGKEIIEIQKQHQGDHESDALKEFEDRREHFDPKKTSNEDLAKLHYLLCVNYEEAGLYDRAIKQYKSFIQEFENEVVVQEIVDDAKNNLSALLEKFYEDHKIK